MKIWWQQPMPKKIPAIPNVDRMWEGILGVLKELAEDGTEITQKFLEKGTYAIDTDFLQMYNNKCIVENILQAENGGYDAVVIGCWTDPGLLAARAILNIPVIGIAEASYLLSCIIGRKAAAITVQPELVPGMNNTLKIYGFENRMIDTRPIRAFDMTNKETGELFIDPFKSVIPKFEAVCRECMDDGADTIIAACGWLGPALTKVGYKEVQGRKHAAPIIDSCAVALKLAESFVNLKKKIGLLKSEAVYYKMTKTVVDIINKNFGANVAYRE
jgi:allantoin racemase